MKSLNKNSFIEAFTMAKNLNQYMFIVIDVYGYEEIIINKPGNTSFQLSYYKNNYNDDLELIENTEIKITNFGCRKKKVLLKELISLL